MHNRDLNALFVLTLRHRLSLNDFNAAVKAGLGHLSPQNLAAMRETVRETRNDIYEHFAGIIDPTNLNALPQAELKAWVKDNFEWMDDETLRLAYNDGLANAA